MGRRCGAPVHVEPVSPADSLIRFTRGLGMARTGDLAGAKAEIEAIKALRAALEKSNQSYWADRSEEQMLAISAWVALKEGRPIKHCGSCARPPTARTAASSTWRWRTGSIRFASYLPKCCLRWASPLPR